MGEHHVDTPLSEPVPANVKQTLLDFECDAVNAVKDGGVTLTAARVIELLDDACERNRVAVSDMPLDIQGLLAEARQRLVLSTQSTENDVPFDLHGVVRCIETSLIGV